MTLLRFAAILVAALTMSSCIAVYESVPASEPHAVLEFSYGDSRPRLGTIYNIEYTIVESVSCDTPRLAATSRQSLHFQRLRIPADVPIKIVATSEDPDDTGVPSPLGGFYSILKPFRCEALAAFTPLAERTYEFKQQLVEIGVCELIVVDTASGTPPSDLSVDNHFACPRK